MNTIAKILLLLTFAFPITAYCKLFGLEIDNETGHKCFLIYRFVSSGNVNGPTSIIKPNDTGELMLLQSAISVNSNINFTYLCGEKNITFTSEVIKDNASKKYSIATRVDKSDKNIAATFQKIDTIHFNERGRMRATIR